MQNMKECQRRWLVLSAVSVTFLILYLCLPEYQKTPETTVAPESVVSELPCLRGVASVADGGRLANKILEYASLWSFSKLYNYEPYVATKIYDGLSKIFEPPEIPPVKKLLKEVNAGKRGSCPKLTEEEFFQKTVTDDELYPVDGFVASKKKTHAAVILRKWIVLADTIVPLRNEIKNMLRFQKKIAESADETLKNIAKILDLSAKDQIIFVGTHVRRTDYGAYLKGRFGASRQADENYYVRAMDFLRQQVGEDAKMVAVAISDDPGWVTNTLIPALTSAGYMAVFSGKGGVMNPGHDLAVLSRCNHSVIAYGTFGIYSALVAGGVTVVHDLSAHPDNSNVTMDTSAMHMAKRMPNWVALP